MRLPLRVVGDYHVDRLEVYAQQCVQLTSTNRPKAFLSKTEPKLSLSEKYCGGYSSVDPPLPIPNREVKHTNADGTAPPGGRVGRCRFSDARLIKFSRASLSYYPICHPCFPNLSHQGENRPSTRFSFPIYHIGKTTTCPTLLSAPHLRFPHV